ncbi:hypothetical protein [Paracoccus methylarcula]|uniref:hypothetical protein n=1 Tax=Paracoccus methylarcula TaxID=72022 RepID=UPI0011CDED12|nr:hypothetical protein [Paracoccus methylarcula]
MTATDIMITFMIALYAMIGGAFLNAAITAPDNCHRVLSEILGPIRKYLLWVGVFASVAYPLAGLAGIAPATGGVFSLPGVWIGLANIALAILLRGCWTVASTLVNRSHRRS